MSSKKMSPALGSVCLNFATILLAAFLLSGVSAAGQTESGSANHGHRYAGTIPYNGSVQEALSAAVAGSTIPLRTGIFVATKDNGAHTVTFVGGTPLAATKTIPYISFLIVPLIVNFDSTTFDPASPDSGI